MPTRIIDHREDDLAERFEHLQAEAERFSDLPIRTAFDVHFTTIRATFGEIDSRRSDVEANPDNESLYQRYLSKVISGESDISDLEFVLTHLDLFTHHRERWSDRIQHPRLAVCRFGWHTWRTPSGLAKTLPTPG